MAASVFFAPAATAVEWRQQQRHQEEFRDLAGKFLHSTSTDSSIFGLPIMNPELWVVRWWDGFMTGLDLTYTAFLVAVSLAFDNMGSGGSFTWLTYADIVGTFCYIVDIVMGFQVGFVVRYDVRRRLVKNGFKVAYYYVYHGQFLVNFIACMPVIPEIITSALHNVSSNSYKAFYVLRLLRLLRVVRLLRAVWGESLLHNPLSKAMLNLSNTATLYLASVVLTLAIIINLLGCIWWFVAELEGLENSWAYPDNNNFKVNLLTASKVQQWVCSCFYVTTTMTTVGYGDITPATTAEQVVAIGFMTVAVFYFGFVVNVVGNLLRFTTRTARTGEALRNKLEDMDSWMSERHLRPQLREKVRQYYVEVWASHTGESWHVSSVPRGKVRQYYVEVWASHTGAGMPEEEYFDELPVALRGEIVLSLAETALAQSYMFRQLSHEPYMLRQLSFEVRFSQLWSTRSHLVSQCSLAETALAQYYMFRQLSYEVRASLAAAAVPVRLVAGHNLYDEGGAADSFFMLQEGEAISIRGMARVACYHSPALLGQASVFANYLPECRHRYMTVRATTNCTLWQFSTALLHRLADHHPHIMLALCVSYLQYLDEMMDLSEKKGKPVARRTHKVYSKVEELYQQLQAETSQSTKGAVKHPAEGLAEASPAPHAFLAGNEAAANGFVPEDQAAAPAGVTAERERAADGVQQEGGPQGDGARPSPPFPGPAAEPAAPAGPGTWRLRGLPSFRREHAGRLTRQASPHSPRRASLSKIVSEEDEEEEASDMASMASETESAGVAGDVLEAEQQLPEESDASLQGQQPEREAGAGADEALEAQPRVARGAAAGVAGKEAGAEVEGRGRQVDWERPAAAAPRRGGGGGGGGGESTFDGRQGSGLQPAEHQPRHQQQQAEHGQHDALERLPSRGADLYRPSSIMSALAECEQLREPPSPAAASAAAAAAAGRGEGRGAAAPVPPQEEGEEQWQDLRRGQQRQQDVPDRGANSAQQHGRQEQEDGEASGGRSLLERVVSKWRQASRKGGLPSSQQQEQGEGAQEQPGLERQAQQGSRGELRIDMGS
ncbi:hypothetical protein N2152v2_009724 [Parachlorella kessleri]